MNMAEHSLVIPERDWRKLLAAAKAQVQAIPGTYSGHHINVEKETPCKPER